MPTAVAALLAVHYAALVLLALAGVQRLIMVVARAWQRSQPPAPVTTILPRVTVQLPLYCERFVAERLLRAVARLDYPRDLLQLQVLDDSTDATRDIVDRVARELRADGLDVAVVRRDGREGYKAGALQVGLGTATGELIAIFDADFVPRPAFLRDTVGHFEDPGVGVVQARWGHLNRGASLLTFAQAALLDGHFVVEQAARAAGGRYFNFNGTAGVWRRSAIDDAGGWQSDTITEDLDLSYRAQLRGWKFVYRADLVADAELPEDLGGLRSQQHRWAKGAIECLRKLAGPVLAAPVPLRLKAAALAHLSANLAYPIMLVVALTMPLVALARQHVDATRMAGVDAALLVIGFAPVVLFYTVASRGAGASWPRAAVSALAAIALDVGLSAHKARAVVEGLLGRQTAFVRTPKFALVTAEQARRSRYLDRVSRAGVAEAALAAWAGFGMLQLGNGPLPTWSPLPFLLLFASGFGGVAATAVVQTARARLALPAAPAAALEASPDEAG